MFVDIFSRISRKKNYKYEEPSSEGSKVTPLALGVKGQKFEKKKTTVAIRISMSIWRKKN